MWIRFFVFFVSPSGRCDLAAALLLLLLADFHLIAIYFIPELKPRFGLARVEVRG